ncbi:hypothetical protein L6R49_18865 [Myxococcota bacterium]|nr:hypothetical protein [Myxococcota bacterium]
MSGVLVTPFGKKQPDHFQSAKHLVQARLSPDADPEFIKFCDDKVGTSDRAFTDAVVAIGAAEERVDLARDARDKVAKRVKAGLKVLYAIATTTLTTAQVAELEGAWGGGALSTLTRRPVAELSRLLGLALPRLRERVDLKLPDARLTELETDNEALAQALSELQGLEGELKNARDAAKAAQTTFVTAYRKLVRVLRLMWGEDKVRATLWHFEMKRGS